MAAAAEAAAAADDGGGGGEADEANCVLVTTINYDRDAGSIGCAAKTLASAAAIIRTYPRRDGSAVVSQGLPPSTVSPLAQLVT